MFDMCNANVCFSIFFSYFMLEEYHSVLLNEEPSAIDCMLKLLEQNDMSFIHLALWVIAQFSNGSKRRERERGKERWIAILKFHWLYMI